MNLNRINVKLRYILIYTLHLHVSPHRFILVWGSLDDEYADV